MVYVPTFESVKPRSMSPRAPKYKNKKIEFRGMKFEGAMPRIDGGSMSLRDSDHTHYGIFENFTYRRGASGAVSRDLILSNKEDPLVLT